MKILLSGVLILTLSTVSGVSMAQELLGPQMYLRFCTIYSTVQEAQDGGVKIFYADLVYPRHFTTQFGGELIMYRNLDYIHQFHICSDDYRISHDSAANYKIRLENGDWGNRPVIATLLEKVPFADGSGERIRKHRTFELRVGAGNSRLGDLDLRGRDGSVSANLTNQ
tara:strand:- start:139 stop:642 length:504 start_codon:yes stop_codon:yes gene_type:complete